MNELLFFLLVFADLAFVLFCWYLGDEWVYASIVVNMLLVVSYAQKLIPIFGFVTNAGNVFYASTFLAMGMIIEYRGAEKAFRMIWIGFLVLVVFILLGQITLGFTSIAESEVQSQAMDILFAANPRVALASFLGYACSHSFNVWCYSAIKKKTGTAYLWLRKNVSTWLSQGIDSILFFSIAFIGVIPLDEVLVVLLTGFVVKVAIAILDTPFMYMSTVVHATRAKEQELFERGSKVSMKEIL